MYILLFSESLALLCAALSCVCVFSARRRRGYRRLKGGFGSKSFNDLDDGDRHSGAAGGGNRRGSGRLRSSTLSSFNTSFDSVSSNIQVKCDYCCNTGE